MNNLALAMKYNTFKWEFYHYYAPAAQFTWYSNCMVSVYSFKEMKIFYIYLFIIKIKTLKVDHCQYQLFLCITKVKNGEGEKEKQNALFADFIYARDS